MAFTSVKNSLPGYGVEVLLLWENRNSHPAKRWITIGRRVSTDADGEHFRPSPAGGGFCPEVIGWQPLPEDRLHAETGSNEDEDFT